MVTLQDIDVALARAEVLLPVDVRTPNEDEIATCLSNARGMLRSLGQEASAALERMDSTLAALGDIAAGR